jgi:very-short-patch-repair endonuclease
MDRLFNDPRIKYKRARLRSNPTAAERVLWQRIRGRQLCGVRFRRQCSVGPYIIDFFAFSPRIAIEVDGESHFLPDQMIYDRKRERFLQSRGIYITRFANNEVMENTEGCLEYLVEVIGRLKNGDPI